MKGRSVRWYPVVLLIALVVVVGCARRRATEPAPPPATPPAVQDTTPPAPPPAPPSEETPPTPVIGSSDFRPAFFDFDSYALREDARAALDHNAKLLRDNPSVKVTIEGHCDERGTVEYNQALGERRAQAARDYLVRAGIQSSRMEIISYGKERPFDAGHDEAAWQQNRRAHFVVRS
jgi:peptidoglycan-associated lipoprotein